MNLRTLLTLAVSAGLLVGCGPEERVYKPKPVHSGAKPTLPSVPTLPNKAKKEGDAYTVWGAIHDLRSRVHEKDFTGKEVGLVGYVVKTNYADACKDEHGPAADEICVPKCAIHKTGKADPADCKAPVPTFWIAANKDEKDLATKAIPVKGWASNFAQLYTYIEALDKKDDAQLQDEFFGMDLPNPLPNVGGKVKVRGNYGFGYTKSTGGAATNPRTGIMTAASIEWSEIPPLRAVLPGMRVRHKENKKKE
ncbi:MAG TPA: hypothetical protein ENK23_06185 [Sorangium sp.]|nr:hypothetical protein [Sorangium sp.]